MALLEPGPLLIIVIVLLLLFGAAAIPKLARSIGRAKGEFQKGRAEFETQVRAGEAEAGRTPPMTEEQLRQTARNLGIEEKNKSIDEVRRAINEKVGF